MSLVGHNALNQAISSNRDNLDPGSILGDLNTYAANAFSRSESDDSADVKDGMDIALCVYNREEGILEYAGAYCPLYVVRQGELTTYKPDKFSIGSPDNAGAVYKSNRIELQDGDMVYVFSDGYADQFGGEKGKKFLYKPFRSLLTRISAIHLGDQEKEISNTMEMWRKGGIEVQEQIDDMLIIGVRHTLS